MDLATPDQLGATPAWERALEAYARELSTGGASAATRAPTGATSPSSPTGPVRGARARGAGVSRPSRYAAALRAPLAKTSIARKLAAARGSTTTWWPPARPRTIPPTCCRRRSGSYLPRVLGRDEVAALLDRIPRGPRSRCATARCSSFVTVRTAGGGDRVGGSRRRRLRLGGRARHGQGAEDAPRSDRGTGSARVATLHSRRRVTRSGPLPRSARCSSRAAEDGSRPPTCGAAS